VPATLFFSLSYLECARKEDSVSVWGVDHDSLTVPSRPSPFFLQRLVGDPPYCDLRDRIDFFFLDDDEACHTLPFILPPPWLATVVSFLPIRLLDEEHKVLFSSDAEIYSFFSSTSAGSSSSAQVQGPFYLLVVMITSESSFQRMGLFSIQCCRKEELSMRRAPFPLYDLFFFPLVLRRRPLTFFSNREDFFFSVALPRSTGEDAGDPRLGLTRIRRR